MTVVCPADAAEVRQAVAAALRLSGPVYLRLGKKGEPAVHQAEPHFVIGRGLVLREGRDVCLLGTGNMVATALGAAALLEASGVSAEVASLHTVKPLDEDLLANVFQRFAVVAVVEEHSRIGGLGGAIAEWLAAQSPRPAARLVSFGTPDAFLDESGSQSHARERFGLTAKSLAEAIQRSQPGKNV
jgi:transketolase